MTESTQESTEQQTQKDFPLLKLATYGKGGIGKSMVSCNLSVGLAQRGRKVLQIGCDPKHDSTFTLCGFMIPTIIDTLQKKDFVYSNVWSEDIIYKGLFNVDCVEAGGPPAGAGCGGYVVGETVKLLKELNAFYSYDVIIFDVLGDIVCGGFAAPLNYSDYCLITTDDSFDSLFAANRIFASIREKARTHPLRLVGVVVNRTLNRDLVMRFAKTSPFAILEALPLLETIKESRILGKPLIYMRKRLEDALENKIEQEEEVTIEEQREFDLMTYTCGAFLSLADAFSTNPEGVVPMELPDRTIFTLLSTGVSTSPLEREAAMAKIQESEFAMV